jgi:hypothetical protein
MQLDDVRAEKLEKAKWFTRGWTLQKLIAPRHVKFFDCEWKAVGPRSGLVQEIAKIARIDEEALWGSSSEKYIQETSMAKRISCASRRETTRKEDEAYCLLGLLGVQMALLYGERGEAFRRLQEGITKVSTDQSIFAWTADEQRQQQERRYNVFAHSPRDFRNSWNMQAIKGKEQSFQLANRKLSIRLPIYRLHGSRSMHVAILACYDRLSERQVGVLLQATTPMDDALIRGMARLGGFRLVKAELQSPIFVRSSSSMVLVKRVD